MALPFQIGVGTSAGPITSPGQQQGLVNGIHTYGQKLMQQPRFNFGGDPAAASAAQENFNQNLSANNDRNAINTDRQMSQANSQELLRSQTAGAGAGQNAMQQTAQGWNIDVANRLQKQSMLLGLISSHFGTG